MTRESIKTKIAALLAKAEGTDNAFEAASFMAKVNELLERHQIEMHEVRAAQGDQDPIDMTVGETKLYASMSWAKDLAGGLARYYGCRFIFGRRGNHFVYDIIGRESARMTFELMLPFVISQVRQQAKRLWIANDGKTRSVWEREVGHALWVRVGTLIPLAEAHRKDLETKALVPVSDVDAKVAELYADLKKGKQRKVSISAAARDAADKVSLHVQATGRGPTKLIGD